MDESHGSVDGEQSSRNAVGHRGEPYIREYRNVDRQLENDVDTELNVFSHA